MNRKQPKAMGKVLFMLATALLLTTGCGRNYVVLHPVGPVARSELSLILLSTILVLIVIVPVIVLLAFIVIRYRDKPGNTAPYKPEWASSKVLEIIWWTIPVIIVGILGTVTVQKTFALMKPPVKNVQPMTIDVTSLDWKWLFEYPGQKIATLNYAEIPTGVPVQFILTSDAPMNSFWVPQLGGQEYTLPGMEMRLWLQANQTGDYLGRGANFTGKGFAHMTFHIDAKPESEFNSWVKSVQKSSSPLTDAEYKQLEKPSSVTATKSYSSFPPDLYTEIVKRNGNMHMAPGGTMGNTTSSAMSGSMANMN